MRRQTRFSLLCFILIFFPAACSDSPPERLPLKVPRGFVPVLELVKDDRLLFFGPFTGYYFRQLQPGDPSRLQFVCLNEEGLYTDDLPVNARLYKGEAVLATLAEQPAVKPETGDRIRPVFFDAAPRAWLENRPQPREEFLHFHSCYNARGAVYAGYWLRHEALAEFTYNMAGRLTQESVLYHRVEPGVDREFAPVIEFDQGPGNPGPEW